MRSRLLAVAAVLVLAAGCGSSTDVDAIAASQDEGGVPLGFGFTTVAGTAVEGPVFPQPLVGADGYVAVMTLTGDPIEVYDAFAGQAARMGFQMQSSRQVCTFTDGRELLYAPDGNATGWTQRPEEASALHCGTTADVVTGDDVENGAYLQLAVTQGEAAGETQSTVTLDLRRHGSVPQAAAQPAPEPGVRGLGEQPAWEPPDRFGLESTGLSMDVVQGSSLVGPVGSRASCAGGYYAVLEAAEDLAAVTEAYEAQIEAHGFQREPDARTGPAGVRTYNAAGGGTYSLSPTPDDAGEWLLISRCND